MKVKRAGAGVRLRFDATEAQLLRGLTDEMRLLLEADVPGSDEVVQRLFPPTYEDPAEQERYAASFQDPLPAAKREALARVREALGERGPVDATVDAEGLASWLAVLTDIRLAIGTRLHVTEETMEREPDPHDPDEAALSVLHWLGWVQESILSAAP